MDAARLRSWVVPALAGVGCGIVLQRLLTKSQTKAATPSDSAPAFNPAPWSESPGSPFAVDFSGRVALVTGAANGLGKAIAGRLVQHGAVVIAVDRDAAQLDVFANEQAPGKVRPVLCDLTDLASVRKVAEEAGAVDFLVNVAGVAIFQQFLEATPEIWDLTMDINARATWYLTQLCAKGMVAKGGGSIVNISSQSSTVVVSDKHLAYSTSKAAVDHITRSAAISLAKNNIRVNAVNPTVVRTDLAIKAHGEEGLKKMAAKVPLGRICEPGHVADVVLFLLSDRASMVTGVTLPVDGGFLAAR